jgi:16S rRNA (cytidine1402-2'-O)-methyltransferase
MSGKLYVIPTPIGNLEDITLRALRLLKEVSIIYCEDTRTSNVLLKHFDINTPTRSYHQHNEHQLAENIVQQLQAGAQYALISDAGMPGISDAGYLLIRACIAAQVAVEVLPGANAFVTAAVGSGIPCDQIMYIGFLPIKKGRHTIWTKLQTVTQTIVLYESPHRILKTLQEAAQYLGATRKACVCRELSKKFETYHRGSLEQLVTHFSVTAAKGEIVLVIEGGDAVANNIKA